MGVWSQGLRGGRERKAERPVAKSMKFVDGLMIHSGDPVNDYVGSACRHVLLRQGVLGIKVKIMLPFDPTGKTGPKKPLPDNVSIVEPKEETLPPNPLRDQGCQARPGPRTCCLNSCLYTLISHFHVLSVKH